MKKKDSVVKVSVGSVAVSIYTVKGGVGGKYVSYRLNWFDGGVKKTEFQKDFQKAKDRADEIARLIGEGRSQLAGVTVLEQETLADLRRMIAPTGLTLVQVVSRFMDNWEPEVKETKVSVAFDRYTLDKAHTSPFHRKDIRLVVGGLAKLHKDRFVSSLKKDELLKYIAGDYSNGRTKNNRLGSIKAFLNWSQESQIIPERIPHVLQKVKPYPESRSAGHGEDLMSASDLQKIMVEIALNRKDKDRMLLAVALQAFAGVRANEMKRLVWENVRIENGKLHAIEVNADKAKNPQRRTIELTDSLRTVLTHVEHKKNGSLTGYKSPDRIIHKIAKKLGIKWADNTLRHTFITHRLELTGDIGRVSLSAGNSPEMVQSNYKGLTTPTEAKEWFEVANKYHLAVRYQQTKGKPVPVPTPEQLEEELENTNEDAPASIDDDPELVAKKIKGVRSA